MPWTKVEKLGDEYEYCEYEYSISGFINLIHAWRSDAAPDAAELASGKYEWREWRD